MIEKVQSDILVRALNNPMNKTLHVQFSNGFAVCGKLIEYDKDTFLINDCGWHRYSRKDDNGNYIEMCLDGENPYNSFYERELSILNELIKPMSDEQLSGGYAGYWTKGTWV